MNENYSIKINRQEGIVEISGADKEWVKARLNELSDIFKAAPSPSVAKPVTTTPLENKSQSTKATTKKRTSGSAGKAQKNQELVDKLTKEVKDTLEAYVGERQANFDKSLPAQAAIIATFLQDELDWQGVDRHDMYTIYSIMGWPAPGNPAAQLNNALSRNQYFGGVSDGKYILSHKGENYARHHSKSTSE
jgi:hypothetical protein